MANKQDHGTPFSATNAGTTSATATQAGTAGGVYYVSDFSVSSTGTAGTWVIYAGATNINGTTTGTTALWQGQGATIGNMTVPLAGFLNGSVYIVANGTTATYANITGYLL